MIQQLDDGRWFVEDGGTIHVLSADAVAELVPLAAGHPDATIVQERMGSLKVELSNGIRAHLCFSDEVGGVAEYVHSLDQYPEYSRLTKKEKS